MLAFGVLWLSVREMAGVNDEMMEWGKVILWVSVAPAYYNGSVTHSRLEYRPPPVTLRLPVEYMKAARQAAINEIENTGRTHAQKPS